MTIDVEVMSEVYTIMKQYITQKDRQECADNLMSVIVDMVGDDELRDFAQTDGFLKRSFKEYAADGAEVDVDEDGDEYHY